MFSVYLPDLESRIHAQAEIRVDFTRLVCLYVIDRWRPRFDGRIANRQFGKAVEAFGKFRHRFLTCASLRFRGCPLLRRNR